MPRTLIKSGHIIDPSKNIDIIGDILIENDKIVEIGENINYQYDECIDANGLIVAPGLVDMHVHLRDPGYTYKEDILSGCRAAVAGGVTTVVAMPNTNPPVDNSEVLNYIQEKAKKAKAKVLPVATITQGLNGNVLNDFKNLKNSGAIAVSDDGYPVSNSKLMRDAMINCEKINLPVLSHCEALRLTDGGIINDGEISSSLGVKGVPKESEIVAIAREVSLAMSTNTSVHICHVSTAESVDFIRYAKSKNAKVTAETGPHYFSYDESALMSRDGDFRMSPPLRTVNDRLAIVQGLADGTIDAIATDHAPHTVDEKSDFEKAPNGTIGMETSLSAGITVLVNGGYISLSKLIYLMSTAPAKILNIDAGTLNVGAPADIVIFSEEEKWKVDVNKLNGKSKNAIFKNVELTGKVKYTICDGKIVYRD